MVYAIEITIWTFTDLREACLFSETNVCAIYVRLGLSVFPMVVRDSNKEKLATFKNTIKLVVHIL